MATYFKRKDFIEVISSMSNKELNDYIKKYGSPPKPIVMVKIVEKNKE